MADSVSIYLGRNKTALEQIVEVLVPLLQKHRPGELMVRVGDSAAKAICCQLKDEEGRLPHLIKGVKVSPTKDFRGWEVYANGRAVD